MAEYQAEFKQEGNVIVVTFPDVGYGATQGATEAEALEMAEDFLVMAIGDLIKLKIKPAAGGGAVTLRKFGTNKDGQKALLCMNEGMTQMFIEGGDQSIDLDAFGIEPPFREFETLGKLTDVWYFTTKDHLRPQDGGTANYHHAFGVKRDAKGRMIRRRDLKACPDVLYDARNQLLSFSGGRYTIPDEGIDG